MSNAKLADQAKTFEVIAWIAVVVLSLQFLVFLNSAGLAEVGSSLLWGAAASAVIVPWIRSWIAGDYGFSGIHLEIETWVIAVIGGAILVLGKMMAQAGRLQSELSEII